jgi:hypothetical protein
MRIAILALTTAALSACAPTLGVQGKFTPQSGLPVGAYRTITVVPFSGYGGKAVSRDLEARLASATFEGKPYFRVLPAPPNAAAQEDAAGLGRRLGADAVLSGHVDSRSSNRPYYEFRDRCVQTDAQGKCTRYVREQIDCYDADADVTVTPKLIDVRTGQLVGGGLAAERGLLDKAREDAIRDIRFDLAPFERKIDVELKDNSDGLTPEHKGLFKQGMDFAKAENVVRACDIWRDLQGKGANTLALAFNLGVCAETAGDFEGALRIYESLARSIQKPDDAITTGIARTREQIEERQRLDGR